MSDERQEKVADLFAGCQSRLIDKVSAKGHVDSATYVEIR